jgi:hypothetical protein
LNVDLDSPRVQLGAKLDELVLVEIVLQRERLELLLSRRTPLLRLLEEGTERCFENAGQLSSLLSIRWLPPRAPGCGAPALEPLDAAAGLDRPLDARVGGMAIRADVDDDLAPRRAGREGVPARRAAHVRPHQLRMNLLQGQSPPGNTPAHRSGSRFRKRASVGPPCTTFNEWSVADIPELDAEIVFAVEIRWAIAPRRCWCSRKLGHV